MNNKAFTLIEVISIIALLGIILVIAIPNFISSRNENQIKEKEKMISLIVNAGRQYHTDNNLTLGAQVQLSELCTEAYTKCPKIDPVTNTSMNGYVTSYINANGELSYRYEE